MHYALLPNRSSFFPLVGELTRQGRLQLLSAEAVARLDVDDHVLLASSEAPSWLIPLSERCRAGRLGSIRLLVEEPLSDWDAIGFRARPWLQEIVALREIALPPGTSPAPVRRIDSLEGILTGAERPAFRPAERPTAFPPKIQIETTAHCGLACPYCPKSFQDPDRTRMEEDLFRRILAECGEGRPDSVELYLSGDPLTDPRLEHLADLAKEATPSSLIEIITHERSINELRAPRLADSGLDAVFVSVNFPEPTPEPDLRERLERIARLRAIFAQRHKPLVIVTLTNLFDADTRARFDRACAELGLPYERFRATTRMGDVDLSRFPAAVTAEPMEYRVCERPFTKAYIRANGNVLLCCEDWNDRWVMGNVRDTPLSEIWNNALYRERRRSLLAGRPTSPCNNCVYAGTSSRREAAVVASPSEIA